MIEWALTVVCFVALIIATITDLDRREVPDWLNYALLITAVLVQIITALVRTDWMYIYLPALGFLLTFGFSALMFYTGQWGGGDAKMLMAMGVAVPTTPILIPFFSLPQSAFWFLPTFMINIFLMGAVYALLWAIYKTIQNAKRFGQSFVTLYHKLKWWRYGLYVLCLGLFITALLLPIIERVFLITLALVCFVGFFIYLYGKAVEKACMYQDMKIDDLTEGEWIAKDIIHKGKYVCGPKDLGVSKKQITQLKRFGFKNVPVKIGIPFIPAFLLGYLMTFFVGNVFTWFFTFL